MTDISYALRMINIFTRPILFLLILILGSVLPLSITQAQLLNKIDDMDFGSLDYDATHSGFLQLGTNGVLTVVSGVGLSHNGISNAGNVIVTGSPANVIEVKCETSGKMRLGNSNIDLQNLEVAINTGVAYGAGNTCQGNKNNSTPAVTYDLALDPTPIILMGAEAVILANSLASGTYSTTSGGAKPVTLTVVYQ